MGEVVDISPDGFLKAMRETGDWQKSCEKANVSSAEMEKLCHENAKYDLATVEAQLEFIEDQLIQATEKAIEQARQNREARLAQLRQKAMNDFRARHPEAVSG